MADRQILIGQIVSGILVHQQSQWATGVDRLVDPDDRQLALTSEVVAAATGIQGAVDTYAELPDPATLQAGALYIVRQDAGAPSGNGLYRVNESAQWAYLDAMNLQDASEVVYVNTTSGLTATTTQAAIDELAADLSALGAPDASTVSFDNTASGMTAADVQAALDELHGLLPEMPIAGDGLSVTGSTWSAAVDDVTIGIEPGPVTVSTTGASSPAGANADFTDSAQAYNGKPVWSNAGNTYHIASYQIDASTKQWWVTDYAPQVIDQRDWIEVKGANTFGIGLTDINGVLFRESGTHLQADAVYSNGNGSSRILYNGVSSRWEYVDDIFGMATLQATNTGLAGIDGPWEEANSSGATPPTSVLASGNGQQTTLLAEHEGLPERFYLTDDAATGFGPSTWSWSGVAPNGSRVYRHDISGLAVLYHNGTKWIMTDGGGEGGGATTNTPASTSPIGLIIRDVFDTGDMGTAQVEATHIQTDATASDYPENGTTFTAGRTGTGNISVATTIAPGVLQMKDYVDGSSDGQSGSAWATVSPTTINDAIDRLATQVAAHFGGLIPE